ncbi:MAG: hypothetical protein AAFP09_03075 [Cyanobacteria bacterium J06607_10]
MSHPKISSYKSLVSIGLLSILVGFLSTACGSTEAVSNSSNVDAVTPDKTIEETEASDAIPAEVTQAETQAESLSEIDPADAYVRNDPATPAPISAQAAGEESRPLDYEAANEYTIPPDRQAEIANHEALIAEEERIEFESQRIDANGNLLPELIEGMTVGMPYSEARSLIIGSNWQPRTDPPVDDTYDGAIRNMKALGFEETRSCAGTGLGLCNMEFVEQEDALLTITVSTSSEVPTVWTWDIN